MSATSDVALLRQLVEFELRLERDSSEVVEDFDWGRLIHNPAAPAMWSGNYLEVQSTDLDAEALAQLAEELQAPLEGIEHRDVVVADPQYAAELAPGFGSLDGWITDRSLYMILRRDADREPGGAREVPREAVEEVDRKS